MKAVRGLGRLATHLIAGTAGVVVAHAASYLVAVPHAHARAEHLHATGHSYWPGATGVAVLASLFALTHAAMTGRRHALDRFALPALSVGWLAGIQLGLFVGMEILERVAAGAPVDQLASEPAFGVGSVLQLVVAGLTCRLLRGVATAAAHVVARSRDARSTVVSRRPPRLRAGTWPHLARRAGGVGSRAPPRPVLP